MNGKSMTTQELHDLAKKIAPLIGYEYLEAENKRDGELHWLAHISRGVNGSLYIENSRSGKDRLAIVLAWPRGDSTQGFQVFTVSQAYLPQDQRERTTSITVSNSKTPEQIAGDIKRRLLADAESLYQEAHGKMLADRNWKDQRVDAIKLIAQVVGKKLSAERRVEDQGSFYFNNVEGNIDVRSATNIKITYDAKNAAQAIKIVEFLKTLHKPEEK